MNLNKYQTGYKKLIFNSGNSVFVNLAGYHDNATTTFAISRRIIITQSPANNLHWLFLVFTTVFFIKLPRVESFFNIWTTSLVSLSIPDVVLSIFTNKSSTNSVTYKLLFYYSSSYNPTTLIVG